MKAVDTTCRFSTPDGESEETRRIRLACRHATEDALRKLREAGLPRTYIRGDQIIEEWPDGHEVNLGTVCTP